MQYWGKGLTQTEDLEHEAARWCEPTGVLPGSGLDTSMFAGDNSGCGGLNDADDYGTRSRRNNDHDDYSTIGGRNAARRLQSLPLKTYPRAIKFGNGRGSPLTPVQMVCTAL